MKDRIRIPVFSAFILAALFLMALIFVAYGNTLTVAGDSGQYKYTRHAIDSAKPAGTLLIRNGFYEESIFVDKDLTIQGGGTGEVVAPGDATGSPVIEIWPSDISVTITGLTFSEGVKEENGSCRDTKSGLCFSGVVVKGDANLTVSNSTFTDNYLEGLYLRNKSEVTLNDNKIVDSGEAGYFLWKK